MKIIFKLIFKLTVKILIINILYFQLILKKLIKTN